MTMVFKNKMIHNNHHHHKPVVKWKLSIMTLLILAAIVIMGKCADT